MVAICVQANLQPYFIGPYQSLPVLPGGSHRCLKKA